MAEFEFKFKFKKLDLNVAKATKTLNAAIDAQVREAAREFVRAAWPLVPVDTGTSRGSLQTLARVLQIAIPIDPVSKRAGRGPAIGELLGTFQFTNAPKASFTYQTAVEWFANHERGVWPPKWGAFDAGRQAFIGYLRSNFKQNVPKVSRYLTRTEVG